MRLADIMKGLSYQGVPARPPTDAELLDILEECCGVVAFPNCPGFIQKVPDKIEELFEGSCAAADELVKRDWDPERAAYECGRRAGSAIREAFPSRPDHPALRFFLRCAESHVASGRPSVYFGAWLRGLKAMLPAP